MLSEADKFSLRLVAWKEARGEGLGGMNAVMHVVLNRVGKPGFAKTIHDVIYGKWQFTSMSVESDPMFAVMPEPTDQSWTGTEHLVNNIESDDDQTKGALYYQNPKTAQKNGWFQRHISGSDHKGLPGHPLLLVLGRHWFYG